MKEKWPEQLFKKVSLVESDQRFQAKANECLESLKKENGPQEALEQIEKFVLGT